MTVDVPRLVDRDPKVTSDELLANLVPPPQFVAARFDNYEPDPAEPSQQAALVAADDFVRSIGEPVKRSTFVRRRRKAPPRRGLYLDGGFGVGKTHLLSAMWHAAPGPKAYTTFTELTQLLGVLGFAQGVRTLSEHRLLCIDEFELDDPGDTVLVSTLMARLTTAGVSLAATSNTLPGALGDGRFDTENFLREIQSLAEHFQTVRIEGADYRHRDLTLGSAPSPDAVVLSAAQTTPSATLDDFAALVDHLKTIHPSRYTKLLEDVTLVCLRDVTTLHDQSDALRMVLFVDRLYELEIGLLASGGSLDHLFDEEMLAGGYRKKYRRALSRLHALDRRTPVAPDT